MVFSDVIDNGRRFHKVGAATMKERSPIVFFVLMCGEHKRRLLLFRRKLSYSTVYRLATFGFDNEYESDYKYDF